MKCISWNVNGLRACMGKGFADFFAAANADLFCLQETKLQAGQIELLQPPGYHAYWNYAGEKGLLRHRHLLQAGAAAGAVRHGKEEHDREGRLITLEFPEFYFATVYVPNSQRELTRLDYRMQWEDDFLAYLQTLDQNKPVIFCGDLNVAHREIDLKNPKTNHKNAGFTDEERGKMTALLDSGFTDTFRYFYPDATGYTAGGAICSTPERRNRRLAY